MRPESDDLTRRVFGRRDGGGGGLVWSLAGERLY